MLKLILFIFILSAKIFAGGFYMQYSFFYKSGTDDAQKSESSQMNNWIYVGAALDNLKRFSIGQSYMMWSKSLTASEGATAQEFSVTELGPRLHYFFTPQRTTYFSVAWHPYVKGERNVTATTQEISGSSYIATIGCMLKVNKRYYFGASLSYYSMTITESTEGTTTTEVSEAYSQILPTIDFSFRF